MQPSPPANSGRVCSADLQGRAERSAVSHFTRGFALNTSAFSCKDLSLKKKETPTCQILLNPCASRIFFCWQRKRGRQRERAYLLFPLCEIQALFPAFAHSNGFGAQRDPSKKEEDEAEEEERENRLPR